MRAWRADDHAALRDALAESVEHLLPWIPWATPDPPTDEQVRERLALWMREFAEGINWVYAAHDADGSLVGGAGLYGRVGPAALEIGYWMRASRAGQGFATEASAALTATGLGLPGIVRLEMHCDERNAASRRVPEKLGFALAAFRRDAARRVAVYVRERGA